MKKHWLLLLTLLPMLLVAQAGPGSEAQSTQNTLTVSNTVTGIRGVVVRWPIKPSSRLGETNSAPMPNVDVSIQPEKGGTQLLRKTDINGRFEVELPPGNYVVVPVLPAGTRFRISKQSLEVKEKHITEVVLTCDTGIR
jgi:hypothetical protein